jgi:hypothetical protein
MEESYINALGGGSMIFPLFLLAALSVACGRELPSQSQDSGKKSKESKAVESTSQEESKEQPKQEKTPVLPSIDPRAVSFVNEYERLFLVNAMVDVEFTNSLPENVAGRCWRAQVGLSLIEISITYWERLDVFKEEVTELMREQLMFHELAHCIHGLKHTDEMRELETGTKIPGSIMYPAQFISYALERDYYIQELTERIEGKTNTPLSLHDGDDRQEEECLHK